MNPTNESIVKRFWQDKNQIKYPSKSLIRIMIEEISAELKGRFPTIDSNNYVDVQKWLINQLADALLETQTKKPRP
jgi:hypothetical protein